jgi:hypothetical protein
VGQHQRGAFLLGALLCVALPAGVAAQATKPSSPDDAMTQFLQAAADSNLGRMSELWGTSDGSSARTRKPNGYQKRVFLMYAYLKGGTTRIAASVPDPDGKGKKQQLLLDFRRGDCQKTVPAAAVLTRNEGWLVNSIDLSAVGVPGRSCGAGTDSTTPTAAPGAASPG